jgi:D-alanyl-D-alanine dipeptidase
MIEVKKEKQDLIELIELDNSFVLDVRYATNDNFTKEILYKQPKVFIRKDVGIKLLQVQQELKTMGLGLKIYDAYRPHAVSVLMWEVTKILLNTDDENELEKFVGNPKNGSRHNRGAAVDLTLINLSSGNELIMPTPFDDFSYNASRTYYMDIINNYSANNSCSDELYTRCSNAKLLQGIMEKHDFIGLSSEWWHFDVSNWQDYDLLDIAFEDII